MVNDANTDIIMDPAEKGYVQKLTSELRARKFRIHPTRIHFQVNGKAVRFDQFFCEMPFTRTYFEQCASLKEEEGGGDLPVNPSHVTGVFSSINIGMQRGETAENGCLTTQSSPKEVLGEQDSGGGVPNESTGRIGEGGAPDAEQGMQMAIEVHGTVGEDVDGAVGEDVDGAVGEDVNGGVDGGVGGDVDENCYDGVVSRIGSVHCEDLSFQKMLIDTAYDLIAQRNKFLSDEPARMCAIRNEIRAITQFDMKGSIEYMLQGLCTAPRGQYLTGKPNWERCVDVEVKAIQQIVDNTSPLRLKVNVARRFLSEPIEEAYINACDNLPMTSVVFEPGIKACGNNEYLMWRSSCPTEVQMRRMAWNKDTIRTGAMGATVQQAYLASCTLTYGDYNCNMRPGDYTALLVRVNLGNCMKLGAEYIIADEKLMIPAYFVSFDVLGPRDPPLPP
tara:strand:+ start:196 stop:1536 length:1341 start_codon:yes stop_codon:yes gene_type:complete